jgi:hypothetical protein
VKRRTPILAIGVIVISLMLFIVVALNGSVSARDEANVAGADKEQSGVSPGQANSVDSLSNYDAVGNFQYLSGPNSGEPLGIALNFIRNNTEALDVTAADVADLTVTDQYVSQHSGVTHIYLQQQHEGIKVYNGLINVNIAADGSVINVGNRLVANLARSINTTVPSISVEAAVQSAAQALDLALTRSLAVEQVVGGAAQAVVLSDGGISQNSIPVGLMYYAVRDGAVRLTWDMEIYELSSLHWWSVRIDAVSGEMISQDDYVDSENWHEETEQANRNPDDYNVFALPKESPSDGPRTIEIDPADGTASPFGWHDTDGGAGAEFTTTQGNNAHAYTDTDANNIPDPGSSPDGGAGLVFSHTLDLNLQPSTYVSAAVTNLFYWNNIMHDVMYLYGFDEAAGNFQENNYGNGGASSDYVNAEAQDGSGTNNANFGTPPDGQNPRMQMFIWTNPFAQLVTVNSPVTITGSYVANPSNAGGTGMGLTADVALVDDGVAPATDACEPLVNDLTGEIALIVWNEGACNSSVFVANAAAAGAVAAIIIDNTPLPLSNFGGDAAIPSVAIGSTDGQLFLDTINDGQTINATLEDNPAGQINRDSDLDAGVIAHEYGHGISNRLTGGPSQAGCLGNAEQMGEGWSDLMTLILHADATDTATMTRGIGTYLTFEPATGLGIRLFPYTTDMTVNPHTYDSIITNGTSPHSLGEVWAVMYWEVYWNLVDQYGFNPDIYQDWTTGGNNLALQLLMDGMKLQPCSPGMVDGRDAILAADQALTGGANQCAIWEGFAKRGLGFSADQGSSFDRTDGTEAFDLPLTCSFLNIQPITQNICFGDAADYNVAISPLFTSPPVTLSSSGEPPSSTVTFSPNPVPTVPMSATMTVSTTASTPGGTYTLTVTATDTISTGSAVANLVVFDTTPAAPTLLEPADGATEQIFQPHFTWSDVPGATEYTIEIATDAGFTSIIETATVAGTSYDLTSVLVVGTTYYWRVRTENVCGTTDSTTSSFTTVSASCTTGTATSYYFEDFDSGAPGWTHSAPVPPDTWVLTDTNPGPGSGSFAYYSEDVGSPNEQHLVSPPIDLPTGEAQYTLQFLNEQNFEDPTTAPNGCWDGGLLEITTDGGATWIQLNSESDPYDGAGNNGPPNGLNLWCGQVLGQQPWLNSIVNLDAYAGETVQFRFRNLADAAAGAEGWYIDDFEVSACNVAAPVISVDPESISQDLAVNNVVTQTLSISNLGDTDLNWTLEEASSPPIVGPTATELPADVDVTNLAAAAENASRAEPTVQASGGASILWEQLASGTSGIVSDYSTTQGGGAYSASDFVLTGTAGITLIFADGFDNANTLASEPAIDWAIYPDAGGVPAGNPETNPGAAVWSYSSTPGGTGVDITGNTITLDLVTAGEVVTLTAGTYWLTAFPTYDNDITPPGSARWNWFQADQVGAESHLIAPLLFGGLPNWTALSLLGLPFTDTAFRLEGNYSLVPAVCDAPDDIPWLNVSPTAGTTVSGTTSTVDVTFDSTGLSEGTYTGSLCIDSNDTFTPRVEVPVTLTVSAPSYGVRIAPSAAITGTAGTSVTYTLHVTNTGNTVDTFDLAVSGNTWPTTASAGTVTLNVGESTEVTVVVDIPSTAADGEMDSAAVTATSQSDTSATDVATLMTTAVSAGPSTLYLPVVIKD